MQKQHHFIEIDCQITLHSYEDFTAIPLTLKEDLQNHSPYGFVAAEKENLLQYHESSGTTGQSDFSLVQ